MPAYVLWQYFEQSFFPAAAFHTAAVASSEAAVRRCRAWKYPSQGSRRSRATRRGTVRTVNRSGSRRGVNSAQLTGTETGAPGRARAENAEIDVFVRLLRR